MPEYTDKEGRALSLEQWWALFEDREYRRVAYTEDDLPVAGLFVSTVWLGIPHPLGAGGSHHTFETLVGQHRPAEREPTERHKPHYRFRYDTEEEARAGHERVVAALRAGEQPQG
jgi:hypothetical protein